MVRRLRRLWAVLNILLASFFTPFDTVVPEKHFTYEEQHLEEERVLLRADVEALLLCSLLRRRHSFDTKVQP